MEMKADFSPVGGGSDGAEVARASAARGTDPSGPQGANSPKMAAMRRLFQDDVFERAARRPMVSLG
jgi:hypothetical protein